MANTESKKLAVDVIARIDKLEKGMAKAASATKAGTDKMRRSTETAAKGMERSMAGAASKIGQHGIAMAKSFAAPLLALGAAGLIQQVGAIANSIATVGDEAKRAGVAVEVLQELGAVAKANRIPIDAMVDGLKEMALRGDEFVFSNGESGSAAEAFTRLGYSADDLKEKLKQPSELFTEIIGKLGQLDQAAQIRIADEIFGGTGGERFVQLIDQGEAGLRSTIQTARDLGQVMDDQVIARAADLDRAFNDVATTVSTNLQQAIVNASYALFDFLQQFKAMEDRTTNSLEERLNGLGRDIVTKDAERLKALSEARSNPGMAGLQTGFAVQLEQEIASLREEEAKILKILQDRKAPIAPPGTTVAPTVSPPGGSGGSDRTSATIREADAVLRLIEAKEHELSVIGMSARELAVVNALRDAGATATDAQRARLTQLVTATFDATAANDRMNQSLEQMADLGKSALSGFLNDLAAGKDAGEAFKNVLADIGSQLLNMGIGALGNAIFPGAGGGHLGSQFAFGGRP
jgi:hypothetical protein